MNPTAILLMAYGTPDTLADLEPYYTDIRRGRKPSPELLKELTERYERVGGRTPLLDITRAQANALQNVLGENFRVYIGMKHWTPRIADAVDEIVHAGHERVIAIALAPHYSRFSIGEYKERVNAALEKNNAQPDVTFIESWNDHPLYVESLAERMLQTRPQFHTENWNDLQIIFSAHSLPERILQNNDPYPQELRETCELVAAKLGISADGWRFAYQSAGRTGEKWLGPDILETLDTLAAEGHTRVLSVPVGFVSDHLEILYDIDIEGMERAAQLGIELHRIPSANATPTFIAALAEIVRAASTNEQQKTLQRINE